MKEAGQIWTVCPELVAGGFPAIVKLSKIGRSDLSQQPAYSIRGLIYPFNNPENFVLLDDKELIKLISQDNNPEYFL